MGKLSDMLAAAQSDLLDLAGTTFTVDGVVGSFTGLLDVTTIATSFDTSGMQPEDTARLTFPITAGYSPVAGHLITADSLTWRVVSVKKGPVEYDVSLTSSDE